MKYRHLLVVVVVILAFSSIALAQGLKPQQGLNAPKGLNIYDKIKQGGQTAPLIEVPVCGVCPEHFDKVPYPWQLTPEAKESYGCHLNDQYRAATKCADGWKTEFHFSEPLLINCTSIEHEGKNWSELDPSTLAELEEVAQLSCPAGYSYAGFFSDLGLNHVGFRCKYSKVLQPMCGPAKCGYVENGGVSGWKYIWACKRVQ